MGIKRSHSARLLRRSNTFAELTLGLDAERLEAVLSRSVHGYSLDRELLSIASAEGTRIADRLRMRGVEQCCGDELSNVLMILSSFLNSCTSEVPRPLLFEVHSLVGHIQEAQRSFDSAIASYFKALWIASCSKEVPAEQLALTLHRTGKLYGIKGKYSEAKKLLSKALEHYEEAHVATDHPIVVDARQSMIENESSYWNRDDCWSSVCCDKRLPLIFEEPERRGSELSQTSEYEESF